jgi:hypothetical protein
MDSIVRKPLFDFDIDDPKAINANYPKILEAIKLSSRDFYSVIKDSPFEELGEKEIRTLRKYLIRGKYRATPFGKFASVGVSGKDYGSKENNKTLDELRKIKPSQVYEIKERLKKDENFLASGSFKLGYLMHLQSDSYQYWEFDYKNATWELSQTKSNSVLNEIYTSFKTSESLTFQTFYGWFIDATKEDVFACWKEIIRQEFLIPIYEGKEYENELNSLTKEYDIDGISIGETGISSVDQDEIFKTVIQEMGSLFKPFHSEFLENIKSTFQKYFDDRQVPLKHFFSHPKILESLKNGSQENPGPNKEKSHKNLWNLGGYALQREKGSIDLSGIYQKRRLNFDGILHLLLKSLGHNKHLLVDANTFLGMGYLGRFTEYPSIYDYQKSLFKMLSEQSDKMIRYFDFPLIESPDLQGIQSHKNVCDYEIDFNLRRQSNGKIPWENVYIYLHNGNFHLCSEGQEFELKPLLQHALNPRRMKCPWGRLFYEISIDGKLGLDNSLLTGSKSFGYLPELRWKNILVQPESWYFDAKNYPKPITEQHLSNFITANNLPRHLWVGYYDQELRIDLENPIDRRIMLLELRRYQRVIVKADPKEVDTKKIKHTQYLISRASENTARVTVPTYPNKIYRKAEEWLSLKVYAKPFNLPLILRQFWKGYLRPNKNQYCLWHFLYYKDTESHIRIRVRLREKFKKTGKSKIFTVLHGIKEIDKIENSDYYPEYDKYGNEGIELSELIFFKESNWILSARPGIINWDFEKKVWFLFRYFLGVIHHFTMEKTFFAIAKENSFVGQELRNHFKSMYVKLKKEEHIFYHGILSVVFQVLEKHPLKESPDRFTFLLLNHLHMLVNRVFLEDGLEVEKLVWWMVYRELGESLYKKR